jgi:dihydroorotase
MEKLFANQIHYCHSFRKEEIVETNEQAFREQYGEDVPVSIIQLLEVPKAVTKLQNVRLIWLKTQRPITYSTLTTEAETHLFQNDTAKEKK